MKRLFSFLLVVTLAFSLTVSVSAYSFNDNELPDSIRLDGTGITGTVPLIEYWQDFKEEYPNANMMIIYYYDAYRLFVSKYGWYYSADGTVNYNASESVPSFTVSGDQWIFSVNSPVNAGTVVLQTGEHYRWSAADILNSDNTVWKTGDVNFTPPPPALQEIILEVVGEEMTVTAPKVGGTMKTLALCGVGLMASLVVLKLFGKKSLLFLRK